MAILTATSDPDRFELFSAAAITGSAQSSGAVTMAGVSTGMFEITTDGNNSAAATFVIEGTNDPTVAAASSGWLPAEAISDNANGSGSGSKFTATVYEFVHTLPASCSAMSWPVPCGFDWLRMIFTGGSAAGLLTVYCQRARGNG